MNTLAAPSRLALYLHLIRWDRPAGSYLLLWPTLAALWIAAGGFPGWHLLAVFVLGTFLMRSAGCAVNDVADRDFDRHVKRTAQRPVTSGALSPQEALRFGAVLAFVAFLLVLTTNLATIMWSVVALAVSIFYPFTKRFFSMPQAVLGVAFSFGIPMAFAAVQSEVPALAWWTFAHEGVLAAGPGPVPLTLQINGQDRKLSVEPRATLAEVLRSVPSRHLVRRLAGVPIRDRWTSVISVSQLLVAARRSQHPRLMQDIIRLVAAVKVAPFDLIAVAFRE